MPAQPIIVSDFDGTLIDHQGAMHPADAEVLRRGAHPPLLIATGRPMHSLRYLLRQNRVIDGGPVPFAGLMQNGAVSYRPGEVVCGVHPFAPQAQAFLLAEARAHPAAAFLFFDVDNVYALNATQEDIERGLIWGMDVRPFEAAGPEPRFTKALGIAREADALAGTARTLGEGGLCPAFSLPGLLEINPGGVSKGHMLADLLAHLRLAGRPVVAAGDGENDRELMEVADLSIAPSSAPETVRARADVVLDRADGLLGPLLAAVEAHFGA